MLAVAGASGAFMTRTSQALFKNEGSHADKAALRKHLQQAEPGLTDKQLDERVAAMPQRRSIPEVPELCKRLNEAWAWAEQQEDVLEGPLVTDPLRKAWDACMKLAEEGKLTGTGACMQQSLNTVTAQAEAWMKAS